jgi:uncharacterized protein (TIGR02145 family)
VLGADGKCWLDRNLGATRVATAFNDYQAYGTLFQWGRGADGHQLVTYTNNSGGYSSISGTTSTLSTTDTPGHANFIMNGATPYDWRNPQNNNLWQGVSGVNNPCPSGFRLPTQPEWSTLVSAANITNYNTAYSSSLKLTAGGYRNSASGALSYQGGTGYYWSSSVNGIYAYFLLFNSSSVNPASSVNRAYGFSVRCVKD